MSIDVATLKNWPFEPIEQRYTHRDTILYALGLGVGQDPLDPVQLRYTYEDGLQALPTMAVVLGSPGFFAKDPRTGIDWVKLLHGEQALELHAPLPAEAAVVGLT
ncbi:MAG TPA: 3-alpha,7-alpha,12-alpha-trihydroxy-5-beta-cholest-24-enoyl-CoA hydratase, partial [Burkholderiaceae bacterium]|nr:3-alpha,7-alpha,12-alpha-trihydroxy-5-beta-cholest-24-enoyl-CoA hydratase [Burkholderiaceae bacterium]